METFSIKKLMPKGEYYERTEKLFKKSCEVADIALSKCTENIDKKGDIDHVDIKKLWQNIFQEDKISKVESRLRWQGGNSFDYIQRVAKALKKDIVVEVEGVFIVKIKNVTWHPQIFGGSLNPEIAPEVSFLQRIKPAYIIFKYEDKKGRTVYHGI